MSQVIIITGMGRSGTSLVASLVQRAGVNIGERLVPPGKANPRGFFEDADFVEFHKQALRKRGYANPVTGGFTFEPTSEEVERASTLIKQREHLPIWGWKDPRTSLFLEFWHQLLPDARFLFVYRHPLDTLLSLVRVSEFSSLGLLEGLEAWRFHNSRIEEFAQHHRQSSLLCHTLSILDQIDAFGDLVKSRFSLDLELNGSVIESVYHQNELGRASLAADVQAFMRALHPASSETYDRINSMADMPLSVDTGASPYGIELSIISRLITDLPDARDASRRRGLLLLLLSIIDPTAVEGFFGEAVRYIRWLEKQRANWESTANEREKMVRELQDWVQELEQGKAWLEEQWRNWQDVARKLEQAIQEQQAWIRELEQGKAWLEEQWQEWRRIADEREETIRELRLRTELGERENRYWTSLVTDWRKSFWTRLGLRLGLIKQPGATEQGAVKEAKE